MAQTTVFSDAFGAGSTLDGANTTPTATSTGYQIASTKSTTGSSIGAGDLKVTFGSTSSGIAEIQALFSTSPISLTSVGDFVDLNITFTDTSGLLPGASSFIAGGLYNSAGSAPVNNGQLASSGIGGTTFPNGNAANWAGYVGLIRPTTGSSSAIVTRPVQLGTAATPNTVQELIGNNFSASGGYNNPAGTSLHSQAAAVALTTGAIYKYDFKVTLGAGNTLTVADTLTTADGLTTLFADSGTASGTNVIATSFDGLAFGDRSGTAGSANTVDISQITVTDNMSAPEPGVLALSGLGALVLAAARRFRK